MSNNEKQYRMAYIMPHEDIPYANKLLFPKQCRMTSEGYEEAKQHFQAYGVTDMRAHITILTQDGHMDFVYKEIKL